MAFRDGVKPVHASLSTLPTGLVRLRIQLIYPEVVVVQVCLFVAMIWRGFDYVAPPDEEVKTLTAVEQALPFTVWGSIFLAAGIVGLLGLAWARWPITAAAHGVAVALYFAFGVGSIVSILARVTHSPSVLAMAWIAAILGSGVITVAVTRKWLPRYRSLGWVAMASAAMASLVIIASSSGVYGWRTATGWLFVQCVVHAMMARASSDEWREHHDQREAGDDAQ